MPAPQLILQFALQVIVILIVCRLAGRVMAMIGQPRVIGEMIAGILLGPSLLGLISPAAQAALFPHNSLGLLSFVSQVGVVLYMFVVGTHLHTGFIRDDIRGASMISLAGIIAPFLLGAALAAFLYGDGRFFGPGASSWHSRIYLGAAMSVTAFPVLARIIEERGISRTRLGTLALTAGATNDIFAWVMLGIVLAGIDDTFNFAGFIAAHAIFASFLLGVAMPRVRFTTELARRIEPVAAGVLVPIFFVYAGLSTQLNLLWAPELLWLSAVVIVLASVGKGAACWAAARLAGRANPEAVAIGALMNARGLMELIILTIGLERGVITPTLFTVMVLMTLVTTVAAGPMFDRAWRSTKEVADIGALRAH